MRDDVHDVGDCSHRSIHYKHKGDAMTTTPSIAQRSANTRGARSRLPLALAALILTPVSMSFAADALEEIIVTAQFRKQNLQETPIAITAVSAETLEARNQTSLATVAAQAPNVVLTESGGAFGPGMQATIRGVGQLDYNPAVEPGVGIYIDDVYYSSLTGANFGLLDLERVEILRGPQGTLAGRNSEGGAIKMYSIKPKGDNSGSARVTWGSRNLLEVRGVGDFPLINNVLFARISGVSHKQDGYVKRLDYACATGASIPTNSQQGDCQLGTEGGKDYTAGRLALRWLATDALEVNLNIDLTQDNSEVAATTLLQTQPIFAELLGNLDPRIPWGTGAQYIPKDPYVSYASFCGYRPIPTIPGIVPGAGQSPCLAPYSKTKVWGTNLTVDWTLNNDLAIKSITAYREFDSRWTEDNDASPASLGLGAEHQENHSFSQELRLSGKFGSAFDYTVGGYYFDQTTIVGTHQMINYVPLCLNPTCTASSPFVLEFYGHDPVKASSYAGFANGSWHITNALDLNAGVRYTKEKKEYTYSRINIDGTPNLLVGALTGVSSQYEGSKTDYRANLVYKLTDDLMTYASVSTGFKGGGVNPRPFVAAQVIPFKPEELTAYEIGVKADFWDKKIRANVAGFVNKYKDIQITLLECPETGPGFPCARSTNAGDATIKGAELEISARPIEGLLIDGSYSYLNFEYDRVDPLTGVQLNFEAPGAVKSKYSVGLQYDATMGAGTLSPRLDYTYQGGYFTNAVNAASNFTKGYHLLNGQLTWKTTDESWSLTVAGKNLLDKKYYASVFDLSTLGGGTVTGQIAPPREYQVQINKKF